MKAISIFNLRVKHFQLVEPNAPHLPVVQNVILGKNYDAIEQNVFYSNQKRGRTKVFSN